jgi:hypothetical protein
MLGRTWMIACSGSRVWLAAVPAGLAGQQGGPAFGRKLAAPYLALHRSWMLTERALGQVAQRRQEVGYLRVGGPAVVRPRDLTLTICYLL